MKGPRRAEFELREHETKPLRVLQAGISPRTGGPGAGYEVTFLVDLTERNDLVKIIEAHRTTDGECNTLWGGRPEDRKTFILLLTFKKPLAARAILEFDFLRHGPIVDCLIDGNSAIRLVPGIPGENLKEVLDEKRGSLAIEVVATVPRERWEELWTEVVSEELEIPREEATMRMRLAQQDTRLRIAIPDFPPLDRLAGMFVDDEGRLVTITKDLLTNRVRRDAVKVTDSFDRFFWPEVEELSEEFSVLSAAVVPALIETAKSGDQLTWICGQLIGNALESIVAALELVRLGHRLQPGVILRTAIEAVCTAAHLFNKPTDLARFLVGKLRSHDTVAEAKKIIPFIGRLYGFLSGEFTHIGGLHHRLQPSSEYESADDEAAKTNIMGIHLALFHVWVMAELVFYDIMREHRYWRRVEPGKYEFDIQPEMRKRMAEIEERLSLTQ